MADGFQEMTQKLQESNSEAVKKQDEILVKSVRGHLAHRKRSQEISAQEMEANLLDRTFYITETSFTFMKKNFGGADSIRVYANEKVELLNTSINSCSLEDPAWKLNASSLTLLENGRNAVVRGVNLKIKEIPIYEKNLNVDVTLKSSHPAPATLRSMSWEGDWSPMHYRRV